MLRRVVPVALTALLAACATPQSLKPGASIEEARATVPRPSAEMRLPDGGSRLQYSGQPFMQSVLNANFDAQGRLRNVEEMMSDEAFAKIRAGRDTQADVLRDFGPPADTFQYRLSNESAFMYRYFTHGGFPAAMFIYFDPATGIVKRTETGLDPWSIRDNGRNQ